MKKHGKDAAFQVQVQVRDRLDLAAEHVAITDPLQLRLQAIPTGAGSFKAICWINDHKEMLSLTYPDASFYPALYVTRGTPEYLYVDVVQ